MQAGWMLRLKRLMRLKGVSLKFSGRLAESIEICGIPHLAKNERDVGHPGFRGRDTIKTIVRAAPIFFGPVRFPSEFHWGYRACVRTRF